MTETRQLICEGACNPQRDFVDGKVRQYRRDEVGEGPKQPVPDEIVDGLRTLQHTAHRVMPEYKAACVICGHVRQYGVSGSGGWRWRP